MNCNINAINYITHEEKCSFRTFLKNNEFKIYNVKNSFHSLSIFKEIEFHHILPISNFGNITEVESMTIQIQLHKNVNKESIK